MVIATFGPSTGWAGKFIDYTAEKFFLEGVGEISLQNVVEYDRQGHLVWDTPGTRAWVVGAIGASYLPSRAAVAAEPPEPTVVATFNPETGWAGKTITHCDGMFTLEDVGRIGARDVLEYDRLGFIAWAYDGLKPWVQQVVAAQGDYPTTKKASDGSLALGWVLSVLGGVIGIAVAATILTTKVIAPDGQ